jgi:hypothetical protein
MPVALASTASAALTPAAAGFLLSRAMVSRSALSECQRSAVRQALDAGETYIERLVRQYEASRQTILRVRAS